MYLGAVEIVENVGGLELVHMVQQGPLPLFAFFQSLEYFSFLNVLEVKDLDV